MHFAKTEIEGVWLLEPDRHSDDRGYFARCWCEEEFTNNGIAGKFVQSSTAFSIGKATLRGLHFQRSPHWETKLVRCTRGAAYVVAVDLRRDSATHLQWISAELTAENGRSIVIPIGCAQGYQTLIRDTEMSYQMSTPYHPESADGYRYDDAAFGIQWPLPAAHVSEKDLNWADYR